MRIFNFVTPVIYGTLLSTTVIAAEPKADEGDTLDTLVITGQKIDRTQLETVSSVHVISSEQLQDGTRLDDLYDVVEATPNVSNTSGFNSLAIRGIANSGPTGADNGAGTIGIFVDNGLQTARMIQKNAISTWDVERIEILRGPQSTTSGRNSLAGQMIIHTKEPEFTSNGELRVSLGEYNTLQTSVMQTGPLSDNLAYRITADYQASDNAVENDILNDDEFNRDSNKNFRGKLLYLTEADGEVLFTLSRNQYDEHGDATVDDRQEGRKSRLNYPSEWETEADSVSLKITHPLSDRWSLISNTGYVSSDFFRDTDFDGNPGSGVLRQVTDEYNINQEILLRFDAETMKSVIGAYYSKGDFDDAYTTSNVSLDLGLGSPILLNSAIATDEAYESFALFTDWDFYLTEQFTLLAGIRADYEKRDSRVSTSIERAISYGGLDPTIDAGLANLIGPGVSNGNSDSFNLLPKLGFNYFWSDQLSTGFVVQRGYRPGGVSTNPIRGETNVYDEEFTTHYEASLRSELMEGRLKINANVFYTDWKDQQVTVAESGAIHPLDRNIENAGESHVKGFEVETYFDIDDSLSVMAGIGYAKTEFDDFESNGVDYSGKAFQFSREWTANLAATYRFNNGWFANGALAYASEGADRLGVDNTELDAYTTVNVKVGYEQERWSAYLFVNNLFDEEYLTERYKADSEYGNAVYGDPRMLGVVASLRW